MSKHVVYGGSTAEIWRHCPGWASIVRRVPAKPVGPAAHAGTAQHTIMERLLRNPDLEPKKFEGVAVPTEGGDVTIDYGHVASLEIALEEWSKIEETFRDEDGEVQIFSERFVAADEDQGGTVDGLIIQAPRAAFIDFKFGQYIVEASGWQNFWYMICARREMPSLFRGVQEWESWIIQPAYEPAFDRVVIPTSVLDRMEEEAMTAISASKAPNPHFVEGEWCDWCSAKLACPAKTQRLKTLTAPNDILDLSEVETQLMKLRSWDKWREDAEERLLHELEHGKQLLHFKLVAKRAIRKWRDEAAVIARLHEKGISKDKYMRIELHSPAQMEERHLLTKTETEKLADPVSSGNTIAPMADKRKAVMPTKALVEVLRRK